MTEEGMDNVVNYMDEFMMGSHDMSHELIERLAYALGRSLECMKERHSSFHHDHILLRGDVVDIPPIEHCNRCTLAESYKAFKELLDSYQGGK